MLEAASEADETLPFPHCLMDGKTKKHKWHQKAVLIGTT